MDTLLELIAQSGFLGLGWRNLVMFFVAGLLIYLAAYHLSVPHHGANPIKGGKGCCS